MRVLGLGICLVALAGCRYDDYDHHGHGPRPGDPTTGFSMTWKLVDARTGSGDPQAAPALDCPAAGIPQIRLDALNEDTQERFVSRFDCAVGNGTTPDVTVGRYAITVDALDAAGTSQSRDTWTFENSYANDLGQVIFLVYP